MDLELTKAQQALREQAREVSLRELAPQAAETDRRQRFPRQSVERLAGLHLLAIGVAQEWGGAGLDTMAAALATEELAAGCASTAAVVSVQSMVCEAIARFGSDAQKRAWLRPLASGKMLAAFALTEAGGSGPAAVATTATPDGDGFVLHGTKSFVTSAPVADVTLVFAVSKPGAAETLSAFLVPMKTVGVSVGPEHIKLGLRGAVSAAVSFAKVRLAADARLGPENGGRELLRFTIDAGRIQAAALAVGIARAAFATATQYAQKRESNGEPITKHQAIQFKLAEMSSAIDAARLLTWRAAAARDRGASFTTFASMAKLESSETATRVAGDAVSVLGGNGCLADFPVERYFRDAKVTEIYEGTSEMQRLGIASALLKE